VQSGYVSEGGDRWENVYATLMSTELSWYEREPTTSLRLVEEAAPGPSAAVVDIGAGVSTLVDRLLADRFGDVTVLDISQHALDLVRERLGERAEQAVTFVHEHVVKWKPSRTFDVWHDRAVFHFLTDPTARDRYVDLAARSIPAGGTLILATFALDGPTRCSGLPVTGYSATDLEETFSAHFKLVQSEREDHVTPGGVVQPFTWAVLERA
jgi:SAM-dependent methyltransferase